MFRDVVAAQRKLLGEEHPYVGSALNNLALTLVAAGEYRAAEANYRAAIEVFRAAYGNDHVQVAGAVHSLGYLFLQEGDVSKAEPLLVQALEIRRRILSEDNPTVGNSYSALSRLRIAQGRYAEAQDYAERVVEIYIDSLPEGSWRTATARGLLGASLAGQRLFERAEPLLVDAYDTVGAARGTDSASARWFADRLIEMYEAWNRPEEAARYR
jgi:tetratricopeptide (TPR) repeat protein